MVDGIQTSIPNERDAQCAEQSDLPLMIYSGITGSVAAVAGFLAAQVIGAAGVLVSLGLIAAAIRAADPVLRQLRHRGSPR
jgi:hypothetical protein